ncbi:MAG: type II toxin-antitoxin system RelE family toxin [Candidatus Aenigmatarchaeota archaeon]
MKERVDNRINELCECPELGKPLRNLLKCERRVHLGHFVLLYEVFETPKEVIFTNFEHHDNAYRRR